MCVIAYKPNNVNFPSDTVLKNCFENNPDGAGFMYALHGKVYIQKGYESWKAFRRALYKARLETGDNVPYVMHFRIATQGYEKCMTHPFPLSTKMSNLKKLRYDCNVGVAHNGIIDITSDGAKDYSDTMKFITDYLALIIQNYSWYKNDRIVTLIERLISGSRLAVLDKSGHCSLLGKGWIEDNGMFYSNSSYSYEKKAYPVWSGRYDGWWDDGYYFTPKCYSNKYFSTKKSSEKEDTSEDVQQTLKAMDDADKREVKQTADPYADFYDNQTGLYWFNEKYCPYSLEDDDSYCTCCANKRQCPYVQACMQA